MWLRAPAAPKGGGTCGTELQTGNFKPIFLLCMPPPPLPPEAGLDVSAICALATEAEERKGDVDPPPLVKEVRRLVR